MWQAILGIVSAVSILAAGQSGVTSAYRAFELLRGQLPPQSIAKVPRTWDDQAVSTLEVPLAVPAASPKQISSAYYYGIPVRPIYKSYAVYHPSKEPSGYIDWLKRQEPQIVFDPASLTAPEDWIAAGERVFDAPTGYGHLGSFGRD